MMDPPYEDKQDYQRVVSALREGLKRFSSGIYAVWYPQLQRSDARQLPQQLKLLPVKSWLNVALTVQGHKCSRIPCGSRTNPSGP